MNHIINLSYWESKYYIDNCDIAIIGAGYVGLSSAYFLSQKFPNRSIHIFERGSIPSGASTKNAGFACFGSMSEILQDIDSIGEAKVLDLIAKRWEGLQMSKQLLGEKNIDFQPVGGYEIFRKDDVQSFNYCMDHVNDINNKLSQIIGEQVFEQKDELIHSFGFKGVDHLIYNMYEGVLNPVKMLNALITLCLEHKIRIHSGFYLENIEDTTGGCELRFNNGLVVQSLKAVIANNGFARDLIDLPVKPARAQIIMTNPIKGLKISGSFHFDRGFYYFRNLHGRILFGGGRHKNESGEETCDFGNTAEITDHLEDLLKNIILPNSSYNIEQTWSGIMGIGTEKAPIIREMNNKYLAVRLGGMGVAIGVQTGKALSTIVEL